MRRQTEEWHPAGIQVAGEKKIKIESRRRQQKHGVLLRCVYLYLCMVGTILTFRLDLGMKFRVLPVAGVLLLFVLLAILKKESAETLNDVVLKLENTGLFSLKEGKRLLKNLKLVKIVVRKEDIGYEHY